MQPNAMTPSIIINGVGEKIVRFLRASAGSGSGLMSSGRIKFRATSVTATLKTKTPAKFWKISTLFAASIALKIPPQNPARLQSPWKDDIIERPYTHSTPTACVFIDMLLRFAATPKHMSVANSAVGVSARDRATSIAG